MGADRPALNDPELKRSVVPRYIMSANSLWLSPHPAWPHTLTMLQFAVERMHDQNYHVLFALAVSTAAVELGLTAYLLATRDRMRGASYQTLFVASRIILLRPLAHFSCRSIIFLSDALWTVLYPSTCVLWSTKGSLDLLADLFGSVLWIFVAAIVWVGLDDLMLCTNPESASFRACPLVPFTARGQGKVVGASPLTSSKLAV
jgi:hypothetical protein